MALTVGCMGVSSNSGHCLGVLVVRNRVYRGLYYAPHFSETPLCREASLGAFRGPWLQTSRAAGLSQRLRNLQSEDAIINPWGSKYINNTYFGA